MAWKRWEVGATGRMVEALTHQFQEIFQSRRGAGAVAQQVRFEPIVGDERKSCFLPW
jgi:hypothetical protein